MPDVKAIEDAVKALPPHDLAEFRRWFADFDFAVWEGQIEADSKNGKLDRLIEEPKKITSSAGTASFEAHDIAALLEVFRSVLRQPRRPAQAGLAVTPPHPARALAGARAFARHARVRRHSCVSGLSPSACKRSVLRQP